MKETQIAEIYFMVLLLSTAIVNITAALGKTASTFIRVFKLKRCARRLMARRPSSLNREMKIPLAITERLQE
jgi:hypothetical protein